MSESTTSISPKSSTTATEFSKQLRANLQTYALVLALIVIWIIFDIATGGLYLSAQNFSNLFRQMTVTAFLSVGMVLVIVTGGIDLSVGRLAGWVSVWVAFFQANVWNHVLSEQQV